MFLLETEINNTKKNTCESQAHLRIYVWHLLMNLKKLLKWINKKCRNFHIYNVQFF